jgi:hypothetical protein
MPSRSASTNLGLGHIVYRTIFGLAAVYNWAFGLWVVLFPRSFFRIFELAEPRYPSIWACLGMVVGLYGFVYAYVARHAERGDFWVWVGLAGKVLGPIGWLHSVGWGELPPRTFPLILANDLVWWLPFAAYLLRKVDQRRVLIAWICVAIHLIACVGILLVRGGTEAEAEMAARLKWVTDYTALWTANWMIWAVASMSLVTFFVVWRARLVELAGSRVQTLLACLVCTVGLVFDLAGESVNVVWLTRPGLNVDEFRRGARLYALLSPAAANGLYCLAGLTLSVVSGRVGFLPGWIGRLGYVTWMVGLTLTVATVVDLRWLIVITGGAVMMLFIPWAACLGWRLRVVAQARNSG